MRDIHWVWGTNSGEYHHLLNSQGKRSLERQLRRSNYGGRKKNKTGKTGVIVTKERRV